MLINSEKRMMLVVRNISLQCVGKMLLFGKSSGIESILVRVIVLCILVKDVIRIFCVVYELNFIGFFFRKWLLNFFIVYSQLKWISISVVYIRIILVNSIQILMLGLIFVVISDVFRIFGSCRFNSRNIMLLKINFSIVQVLFVCRCIVSGVWCIILEWVMVILVVIVVRMFEMLICLVIR